MRYARWPLRPRKPRYRSCREENRICRHKIIVLRVKRHHQREKNKIKDTQETIACAWCCQREATRLPFPTEERSDGVERHDLSQKKRHRRQLYIFIRSLHATKPLQRRKVVMYLPEKIRQSDQNNQEHRNTTTTDSQECGVVVVSKSATSIAIRKNAIESLFSNASPALTAKHNPPVAHLGL